MSGEHIISSVLGNVLYLCKIFSIVENYLEPSHHWHFCCIPRNSMGNHTIKLLIYKLPFWLRFVYKFLLDTQMQKWSQCWDDKGVLFQVNISWEIQSWTFFLGLLLLLQSFHPNQYSRRWSRVVFLHINFILLRLHCAKMNNNPSKFGAEDNKSNKLSPLWAPLWLKITESSFYAFSMSDYPDFL